MSTPLPTLATMVELYGASMGLALEARLFLRQMVHLKRLALNAEVLAVRVGEGSEVFQTLAREIGRLTDDANQVIRDLQTHAVDVSTKAVRSAALARLCERYDAAVRQGVAGATLERVRGQRDRRGAAMVADIGAISGGLARTGLRLAELDRMHVQLPMIATMLNIEANRRADSDPALKESARSLLVVKQELAKLLERIGARIADTRAALRAISAEGAC
jgi:hypothetical protein